MMNKRAHGIPKCVSKEQKSQPSFDKDNLTFELLKDSYNEQIDQWSYNEIPLVAASSKD